MHQKSTQSLRERITHQLKRSQLSPQTVRTPLTYQIATQKHHNKNLQTPYNPQNRSQQQTLRPSSGLDEQNKIPLSLPFPPIVNISKHP